MRLTFDALRSARTGETAAQERGLAESPEWEGMKVVWVASAAAGLTARRRGSRVREVTCLTCGRGFVAIRSDCSYCSSACRQRDFRQRRMVIVRQDEAALPMDSVARFEREIDRLAATGLTGGEQVRILCAMVEILADHDWHPVDRLIGGTRLSRHPRAAARAAEHARPMARSSPGKLDAGRRVLADAAALALGCEQQSAV